MQDTEIIPNVCVHTIDKDRMNCMWCDNAENAKLKKENKLLKDKLKNDNINRA